MGMGTVEKIASEVSRLEPSEQAEVLNFVEFLKKKHARKDGEGFYEFSLSNAMRGVEEEPDLYSAEDIRASFK